MENMGKVDNVNVNQDITVNANSQDNLASEAVADIGQQANQSQAQEDWDYTKDARWNKMWKDPKDVYKSYRNLEKEYETIKPIKSEYENLKKTFQDNGLPVEKLNDYINQYKQLSDPQNPRNMIADYFSEYIYNKPETHPFIERFFEFVDKPEYKAHLENFFNDLQVRENQRLYPNMSNEQIQHIKQMETKVSEFEKMLDTQKEEQLRQQISKETTEKLQEIQKYATDRGLQITDEMKANLAKYCLENGYGVKQLKAAFIELYGQELESIQLKRHEESLLKKLNQNNKNVVPNASTKNQSQTLPKDVSIADRVAHYMNNLGKK